MRRHLRVGDLSQTKAPCVLIRAAGRSVEYELAFPSPYNRIDEQQATHTRIQAEPCGRLGTGPG